MPFWYVSRSSSHMQLVGKDIWKISENPMIFTLLTIDITPRYDPLTFAPMTRLTVDV